jgi:hypothetical protein
MDFVKEKRLLRLVNKARAIADIYSQASLLVPLSIPQVRLPQTISLNQTSPWHVSALFSAALESTSLYTRLRMSDKRNSTSMGHVTDALNVFGKQTIANLQMSPIEPPISASNGHGGTDQIPTNRGELSTRFDELEYEERPESGSEDEVVALDVDLSSLEEGMTHSSGFRSHHKPHLFSQLSTSRGNASSRDGEAPNAQRLDDAHRRVKTYG